MYPGDLVRCIVSGWSGIIIDEYINDFGWTMYNIFWQNGLVSERSPGSIRDINETR